MFGGAKPLFFFFLLLNSLCRDTLKNWNDSLKKFLLLAVQHYLKM